MPKPVAKTPIKVTVDIRPGPASQSQKAAWRKLFTRLIAECQTELRDESEDKKGMDRHGR